MELPLPWEATALACPNVNGQDGAGALRGGNSRRWELLPQAGSAGLPSKPPSVSRLSPTSSLPCSLCISSALLPLLSGLVLLVREPETFYKRGGRERACLRPRREPKLTEQLLCASFACTNRSRGFPGGSVVGAESSSCHCRRRWFSLWVGKIP